MIGFCSASDARKEKARKATVMIDFLIIRYGRVFGWITVAKLGYFGSTCKKKVSQHRFRGAVNQGDRNFFDWKFNG